MSTLEHTAQNLKEARDLIATPDSWSRTLGTFDKEGNPCDVSDPKATRFSAEQAIARVHKSNRIRQEMWEALDYTLNDWLKRLGVSEIDPEVTVLRFNVESSHAMVLALFDETIERLRQWGA